MAYKKETWFIPYNFSVNKCPFCEQEFVVLVLLGGGVTDVVEQVGPTIYCYMCGKRFDEEVNNESTT